MNPTPAAAPAGTPSPRIASVADDTARSISASGVYITDAAGRVLIVRNVGRPHWVLPGGKAERYESPQACARREAREEVGVEPDLGRLLVVQFFSAALASRLYGRDESYTVHTFAASLTADQVPRIRVPTGEIAAFAWHDTSAAAALMDPPNAAQLHAAADMSATGRTAYLEDGVAT
ncbi:NUDIX domain-containing protein [Yinghuangia seranimata]|uniref:NUDIX domain-containing protein n=1 Tax=Yinghuangia seranimata TaxID=408067 RepID=UPI00248AC6AD|nr:NUDIX hydrolase [Yinghuangia seranimata]MDI2130536.1 NUDIX hydrolase [Yinghuangia seranimata]